MIFWVEDILNPPKSHGRKMNKTSQIFKVHQIWLKKPSSCKPTKSFPTTTYPHFGEMKSDHLKVWKQLLSFSKDMRKIKSELAGPQNHSYWFVWQTHGKTLRLHLQIPPFMVQIPILSHKTQKLPYLGFYLERDWTCWWARWAGLGADLGVLGALSWGVGFGRAGVGVGFGSGGRAGLGWARLLWICFDLIDLLALFGVYAGIIFKATSMTLVQASANYARKIWQLGVASSCQPFPQHHAGFVSIMVFMLNQSSRTSRAGNSALD